MKKGKNRSEASIRSGKSDIQMKEEIYVPPLDTLTVKVLSLRLTDEDTRHYVIKVTFFDQLILTNIIKPMGAKDFVKDGTIARGTMNYDPSDYEKMCLFADTPLVVKVQPLKNVGSDLSMSKHFNENNHNHSDGKRSGSLVKPITDISCCNIDILPIFIDKEKLCVQIRMQPMTTPSFLYCKSWDNLPLLTVELVVTRNPLNAHHHKVFKQTNYMKITLVGSYNMLIPYEDDLVYVAATKIPIHNDMNSSLITFNQGDRISKKFDWTNFYPKWESLRVGEENFDKGDKKFTCSLERLQNNDNIDLEYYLTKTLNYHTITWGSFHRTLLLKDTEKWFCKYIHEYQWPFELHVCWEHGGYSFMAFLDLFQLLYPGEHTVCLAVPLQWINSDLMADKCGCDLLLAPNEKPSTPAIGAGQKPSKITTNSVPTSTSTDIGTVPRPTGADDDNAFVIIELKLARPLKKSVIPPKISESEIYDMLREMEQGLDKRECTGRGQLERDWHSTIKSAANSLRKVPYYGITELCAFNRQLSETRTRVEILNSFWMESAVYVNNKFVMHDYLRSNDTYEELIMMAHACLMRSACDAIIGVSQQELHGTLRAARHARQLQDTAHATDLYLQLVAQTPHNADYWRELSTCLKDVNKDWANVCINKSVVMNPRNPLSLLSKGCMLYEEDLDAADLFFTTLLAMYPFWFAGWVIVSAFFVKREQFHMADQVLAYIKRTKTEGLIKDIGYPLAWERELGDWWDHAPLLPGICLYYEAADLLLRIRAIPLAEVCLARALSEDDESPAYFHMVALCCRLRGNVEDALCHVQSGLDKFGEISYLQSLKGECLHKQNKCADAIKSFEKIGNYVGAYSILLSLPSQEPSRARQTLVDLLRRQPNAYTWMALADDWIKRTTTDGSGDCGVKDEQASNMMYAQACAEQALKVDRRAGRAWALLAKLVKPHARRLYCKNMAISCGYSWAESRQESNSSSRQSACHLVGTSLPECRCKVNQTFRL